ncbi:MAG: outer membrane protein [Thermoleophilia bacterium]|nr:outer membrane protein [Thermoleophilia bacterium]
MPLSRLAPLLVLVLSLAALLAAAPSAHALVAATGTWVSGVGDDVNPCSRTAPCKTFAGAISKTSDNGEIRALDPGGFGAVSITRAMSINGEGTLATILHPLSYGITVNAGANDDVLIRDIGLHGAGSNANPCTGTNGINILSARTVTLQNVTIDGDNLSAINVAPTANPVTVVLDNVRIQDNCTNGVNVAPVAGQAAKVLLRDSVITHSGVGLRVAAGGVATVSNSTIYGNTTGLVRVDTGIIDLSFSSLLRGNDVDGTPTSTFGPVGPTGAQGPQGAPGAPGATGPQGSVLRELIVVPTQSSLRSVRGRSVAVGYVATAKAITTLTIKKAGRQVARIASPTRRGANRLVWNGRYGGTTAPAGVYTLTLRSVGDDDQVGSANVTLSIVAPPRPRR